MGILNKLKQIVNGDTDNAEREYSYEDADERAEPVRQPEEPRVIRESGVMSINSPSADIHLKIAKPQTYAEGRAIAEHLLAKNTVVLNLENANKETGRRLIDFLSGVVVSIGGDMKRAAANIFVISPGNVDISNDQLKSEAPAKPAPTTALFETSDIEAPRAEAQPYRTTVSDVFGDA